MHHHPLRLPFVLLFVATAALGQSGPKPTIPLDMYGEFERLGFQTSLSPDGQWVAYTIDRVDGSHELRARRTEEDAETLTFDNGRAPAFSNDGAYLAWRIVPSEKERERLEENDEEAGNGVGLLSLADAMDGTEQTFNDIASFAFDESGQFLALLAEPPSEPEGKGADLRILTLADGSEITFGNVSDMAWSESGSLLALTIATGTDAGNGIQLYDAASGRLSSLDSSESTYLEPAWRDDAADLAVLRTEQPADTEEANAVSVLAWRDLDTNRPGQFELAPDTAPDSLELVRFAAPEWSDDGSKIALGLRPCDGESGCIRDEVDSEGEDAEADVSGSAETDGEGEGAEGGEPDDGKPEDETGEETEDGDSPTEGGDDDEEGAAADSTETDTEEPDLPNMQLWHSKDRRLFPEQQVSETRDAMRALTAVWHLDDGVLVQLGRRLFDRIELRGDWSHALESTSEPYGWGDMFGRPYSDVWQIDVATGDRKQVLTKVRFPNVSPDGRHVLWFDGEDHQVLDTSNGETTNLTESIDASFANAEYDTPTDLMPPYGNGGWMADDEAVLLYDRFDVWRVSPNGSDARRLTDGAEQQLIYRVIRLDRDEESHDPGNGLMFSLRNETTEQRGYARLTAADLRRGSATASPAILGDFQVRTLVKADDADVLAYVREAADDSPDLFVTDATLTEGRQISETNPFLADYAWTRSELVDFTSEEGKDLQAALLYPVNYEEGKSYPMIVYTYEILAPQIHQFTPLDERRYYNFSAWTQEGYFVLRPDIVYTAREPGPSALASVRAAVKTVVDMGLADEDRVGLIGHSWGGYQATYLPTRTGIFAASVAGAPLTDFVSFMGQLHWNPGIAELSHWETGQARMEVPFWEDPDAHRRSSPIHKVHEMETPLLMAFGNEDGVVDWDQGTEFFNFARRAGKQMVLLVYEGEDHGFREEANQRDYHRRILEWFGHYLKGNPAPAWITDGVAYEDLEEEKKRVARGE